MLCICWGACKVGKDSSNTVKVTAIVVVAAALGDSMRSVGAISETRSLSAKPTAGWHAARVNPYPQRRVPPRSPPRTYQLSSPPRGGEA